jgi:RNA polymerase sigma-70 factor (ECF subfamily)
MLNEPGGTEPKLSKGEWNKEGELGRYVSDLIEIQPELRSFVAHLIPFATVRDDIVQEVNVLLMEKRTKFEMGTNFRAWVFTFARNVTMKYQKKARERREVTFDPELFELLAKDFVEEEMAIDERLFALRNCLGKMKDDDRVFLLGCYERRGNPVKKATEEGVSSSSIRGLLFRLRMALRKCIEREMLSAS